MLKKGGRIVLDINDQDSEFSKEKNRKKKMYFLQDPIIIILSVIAYRQQEFVDLVKDYFLIKDSGYSCHKLFERRINEWIICGEN